jgi:trimeric autotransporter adhesin
LDEVERYIKDNQHLPDIASGEMEEKGLLQKVEELMLYLIDVKKEVNKLSDENQMLKKKIAELEK